MVVIRLARGGAKKNPFYQVVVADSRYPRDGRFIERVGYFNPMARGQETRLTLEKGRIDHWINVGAKASERVKHLIKKYSGETELATQPTKAVQRKEQSETSAKKAAQKAKAEAEAAPAEAAPAEAEQDNTSAE